MGMVEETVAAGLGEGTLGSLFRQALGGSLGLP